MHRNGWQSPAPELAAHTVEPSAAGCFIWKWTMQNAVNCFTTDFGSHGLNGVMEKIPNGTPRRLGESGKEANIESGSLLNHSDR